MVVELLVRLKQLAKDMPELFSMAGGASRWETVSMVSAARAAALAALCAALRPKLLELAALLERVEERARREAEAMS